MWKHVLSVPLLSIGVTEAYFARSRKVIVLKQQLVISVRDSVRDPRTVLVRLSGIWFSHSWYLVFFTHSLVNVR